jgi:uncharacterized protein YciU (UPF0263 family)
MNKILPIVLLLLAVNVCAGDAHADLKPAKGVGRAQLVEVRAEENSDKMSPVEIIHEVAGAVHDVTDVAQEVVGEVHDLAEFAEVATGPVAGDQEPTVPELDILQQLVSEIKVKLGGQGLSDEQIYDFFSKINGLKLTPAQIISFLKDFSAATSQDIDTSSNSIFGKISSKLSSPKYAAAISGVTCLIVGILVGRYILSKTTP